jgi:hypothetical protein
MELCSEKEQNCVCQLVILKCVDRELNYGLELVINICAWTESLVVNYSSLYVAVCRQIP